MGENENQKKYDLEERTLTFARRVRIFVKKLPRTLSNIEDAKQLIRSSGSVGANYIEANESLGKKDLALRIKICRKEAKESHYWLSLLYCVENSDLEKELEYLKKESMELMNIFAAILQKVAG